MVFRQLIRTPVSDTRPFSDPQDTQVLGALQMPVQLPKFASTIKCFWGLDTETSVAVGGRIVSCLKGQLMGTADSRQCRSTKRMLYTIGWPKAIVLSLRLNASTFTWSLSQKSRCYVTLPVDTAWP